MESNTTGSVLVLLFYVQTLTELHGKIEDIQTIVSAATTTTLTFASAAECEALLTENVAAQTLIII